MLKTWQPVAMSKNRECGRIYYAYKLEGVVDDKTEVMLVRHIVETGANPDWVAAIPTTSTDREKDVTMLEWIGDNKQVERTAVRYVRVPAPGLRLKEDLPTTWEDGEYRAFDMPDIPLTALVTQDPTLLQPYKPPTIEDLPVIRPVPKPSAELTQPELLHQLLENFSGLAADVKELKEGRRAQPLPDNEARELKGGSRRLAFGAQPGDGRPEELLRQADLIAAQGRGAKDREREAGATRRDAERFLDSGNSASDSEEEKEKKRRGDAEKKKKTKKKKKSKKAESPTSSRSDSSERSSSGDSRSGRTTRRGGVSKLLRYQRKKAAARRKPMERWRHLEKLAAKAGYTGEAAVERYVGDTTKLGKSKTSLYLASLLARCGERAAAGDAKGAAGTAAGALMFYELLHQYGDLEVAWMMALEDDPMVALKNPHLEKTLSVPDPAQAQSAKKGSSVRLKFGQLAEPETLDAALEACKSWAGYDALARGLQSQ